MHARARDAVVRSFVKRGPSRNEAARVENPLTLEKSSRIGGTASMEGCGYACRRQRPGASDESNRASLL